MAEDEAAEPPPEAPAPPTPGERFSINKVQVRPRKPIESCQDEHSELYLTRLPTLPCKKAPYIPMPYTFRVKSPSKRIKVHNLKARSPPFYLLFDHTIAVIWLLFANEGEFDCPLGIAQLQWAMEFLKTIHTRQGDYPPDVKVCVEAIENILIERYAELSTEVSNVDKLDETVHYLDGALGSNTMLTTNIPFSLNYSELFSKCPDVQPQGPGQVQLGPCKSITSAEAMAELENIKQAAGVASITQLDSVSREKYINILKCWKTDQVEKIREELKRLRSIEDRMKNVDENFDGYIGDDLEQLYPK